MKMALALNSNTDSHNSTNSIKFLYSYYGQILPRPSDGSLRYVGGITRVLSVDRYISFAELMVKFGELCGVSMNLKCKLPREDLDVLVSIKSDEELQNLIGEYERESPGKKIRAVLIPITSSKMISPPSSPMSCLDFCTPPYQSSCKITGKICYQPPQPHTTAYSFCSPSPAVGFSGGVRKDARRAVNYCRYGSPRPLYLAPCSSHRQ